MKFIKADSIICGSNHTPSNFENLNWWDENYIIRETKLRPALSGAADYQINKDDRLDLVWNDSLIFKNVEFYHTHGGLTYAISDTDIPPTDDQLKAIILQSYKQLMDCFGDRQKEQPILPPLSDLSEEKIEQTVSQLREFFLDGQE